METLDDLKEGLLDKPDSTQAVKNLQMNYFKLSPHQQAILRQIAYKLLNSNSALAIQVLQSAMLHSKDEEHMQHL